MNINIIVETPNFFLF